VRTWLRAGQFPERASPSRGPRVPTRPAPYVEHLAARYAAGERDVRALAAELRARGYAGTTQTVRRAVARLAHGGLARGDAADARPKPPSPRRVSWLLFATDDELAADDRAVVADVGARCPPLGTARTLAHAFRRMLRGHDTAAFLPWLATANRSPLERFVRGLRYDVEAVYGGIALPWSPGQVEGQVHRLKLVKRSMYGRAGFGLLRRRVLAAAEAKRSSHSHVRLDHQNRP